MAEYFKPKKHKAYKKALELAARGQGVTRFTLIKQGLMNSTSGIDMMLEKLTKEKVLVCTLEPRARRAGKGGHWQVRNVRVYRTVNSASNFQAIEVQ